MTAFLLLRARWRLFWHKCPACNGYRPPSTQCGICWNYPRTWRMNALRKRFLMQGYGLLLKKGKE